MYLTVKNDMYSIFCVLNWCAVYQVSYKILGSFLDSNLCIPFISIKLQLSHNNNKYTSK